MQDAATPLANQLLIASPALSDPNFARSVTLICQHDDDGAMGVIVNRASEYTLGEVLRQMNLASQDPRLDRRLDPEKVAQRVVDLYLSFDTELKKIVAPLGRSTSLPIGMSDALGIGDADAAERLKFKYVL